MMYDLLDKQGIIIRSARHSKCPSLFFDDYD